VVSDRPPRPLTREQAAELLGLHPRTLDRWVDRGRLRVIDLRGTVRIPVTELARVRSIRVWTRFG
jgi:excisionase family DNA binding protein